MASTGSLKRVLGVGGLALSLTLASAGYASDAGKGAAIGAFAGLILGFDFFDVAAGALIGAGIGAASDASSGEARRSSSQGWAIEDQADRLSDLQQDQAQLQEDKAELSAEMAALDQERALLEAQIAARQAAERENAASESSASAGTTSVPVDDALGAETVAGFEALVRCAHEEAIRYSMPGRLADDDNHRLAARWLEVLIVDDLGNTPDFTRVLELDSDITTVTEAQSALREVATAIAGERAAGGLDCG
ncbi:MAG: hypothetical protein AAGE43_02580 [Pseudomonadota bacterium]